MNTLLKRRIVALFSFLLLCVGAQAASILVPIENGKYFYSIDTEANFAIFSKISGTVQGDITIPSTISYGGKAYPVTGLGGGLFLGCGELTSIKLPASVTSLPDDCFAYCAKLNKIEIPSSVTKFGDRCFLNCTGLASINIPSSVTSLGESCFNGCSGLTSIVIPSSVTSLPNSCFADCSSLASINITGQVTSLEASCFSRCTNLKSVTIPSSVTSLGDYCFSDCTGLTSINVPQSVANLGKNCFNYCKSLTSVVIPSALTSLGDGCFEGCTGLQTVYASLNEVYASEADNWHFANALSTYKDKLKPYIQFVTADGTPYKYATLCLKNRVNLNDGTCENMGEIYTVTSANSERVVLEKVTGEFLMPGVAYIVANNNSEGLTIPNGATFTLDKTAKVDEPVESDYLQGVFEDTPAIAGTYGLQSDNKFHIVAPGTTFKVGAYKAYLKIPGSSNVRALSIQFGGETTGIDGITETKKEADTNLYDLTGRRVTTPQKGQIYIRSGKKVLY